MYGMWCEIGYKLKTSAVALGALFFPKKCIACGAAGDDVEGMLCTRCRDDIPLTYQWGWKDNPAERRLQEKTPVKAVCSLFFYRHDDGYSNLVKQLKYGAKTSIGLIYGETLGKMMAESGRFGHIQAIAPVPLHFFKQWQRGYNQSEYIARGIAKGLGLARSAIIPDLAVRRRYTRTQTRVGSADRAANVAGAFSLNAKAAAQLHSEGIEEILIVDDVLTTGATLASCIAALSGEFSLSAATLASVE